MRRRSQALASSPLYLFPAWSGVQDPPALGVVFLWHEDNRLVAGGGAALAQERNRVAGAGEPAAMVGVEDLTERRTGEPRAVHVLLFRADWISNQARTGAASRTQAVSGRLSLPRRSPRVPLSPSIRR
jgi:predicted N-formylglutamate amidohydrolase